MFAGAREEAARTLLRNHAHVLRDVINPSLTRNINGKLLTQPHLRRVPVADWRHVDRLLRHVVSRLLHGDSAPEKDCTWGDDASHQAAVWVAAAKYLEARIHSKPSQKPGRPPDMSPSAAAALKEVLRAVVLQHPTGCVAPGPAAATVVPQPARSGGVYDLFAAFSNEVEAIVFTQAEPPYRITHVNKAWVEMCGYDMCDVEGATNSILQGPDTDAEVVRSLMAHVSQQKPASATVINYKRGGERFINMVRIEPVYDDNGHLVQYMAILHEVDSFDERMLTSEGRDIRRMGKFCAARVASPPPPL